MRAETFDLSIEFLIIWWPASSAMEDSVYNFRRWITIYSNQDLLTKWKLLGAPGQIGLWFLLVILHKCSTGFFIAEQV